MTYHERLNQLRDQSIVTQREFLKVVSQIRELALKGEALEEKLLFERDGLFNKFNQVLTEQRRLLIFAESNAVQLDAEYSDTAAA